MKNKKKGILICSLFVIFTMIMPVNVQAAGISEAKALSIVKNKVPNAFMEDWELDYENGLRVYEASLHKNGREYDIHVNAYNGKIVLYEWERESNSYGRQNRRNISKARVRKIALKKVPRGKIKRTRLSYDDGMAYYNVHMTKGAKMYLLEIDAKTGRLLQYKWRQ